MERGDFGGLPGARVTVDQADGVFAVRHGLEFDVSDNLLGDRIKTLVTKRGPLVGAIRFESMEGLRSDRKVKNVAEMDSPRSKTWVEVRWTVEDPYTSSSKEPEPKKNFSGGLDGGRSDFLWR